VYAKGLEANGEAVDLVEHVLPYRGQEREIVQTLSEFRARNGAVLTYRDEQEIISAAHGGQDRLVVEGLVATREMHRRRMNRVMDGQRSGKAGDLIRAVSSRLVVVHDEPLALLERPFAAEAFSLHPGSLYGLVRSWLTRQDEVDEAVWAVQALHDLGDEGEQGRSVFRWLPVQDSNDVVGSALVLVHPALAGYDPDLGFVPDGGTGYRARILAPADDAVRPGYSYSLESYAEHIRLVYGAFRRFVWPELARAGTQLERVFGWKEGVVERLGHLVVLFHDVGKLTGDWQKWVKRYQRAIGKPAPDGFFAHTRFDPTNSSHVEKQRTMGRKPPHAVEGAVAVAPLLAAAAEGCEPVFNAAFTSIARHHGAFAKEYRRYELAPGAVEQIADTLAWSPHPIADGLDPAEVFVSEDPALTTVNELLIDPRHSSQYLAYVILARALRRSDQLGAGMGRS
jgi:CRISPR-associated endonuclease Cas3-HD